MTYAPPNIMANAMKMPMIGTLSLSCGGSVRLAAAGGTASAVWSLANRAIFIPVSFPATITVKRMWVATGATGGTNTRSLGIYREDGTQILASTATLAGTASQVQFLDTTDITLPPGSYYIAMSQNGVTATCLMLPHAAAVARNMGFLQMATAYPLPATATFAAITSNSSIPLMGVCTTATP